MCLAVGPNLPGLALSINPKGTHITTGAKNLFTFAWLFGFTTSIVVYVGLSIAFPVKEAKVESTIYGNIVDEGRSRSDVESLGQREPRVVGEKEKEKEGEKGGARSTATNF